jgi:hypothetical protein
MGLDGLNKTMESISEMADEEDRCKECGCLLSVNSTGEVQCKNQDCKNFNLIIRRVI